MAPSRPTLLVFTLGPGRESARRALLPSGERGLEVELRSECFAAALEAGRASGCDLEVCSPVPLPVPDGARLVPQAAEGGFGRRLEWAMAGAFERGASPLLVVGTDVPGLAASHLAKALEQLAEDPARVVVGPSPDGGFYLLATARPIPGLGEAVRWCCPDTLASLLCLLQALGRPALLLEPLADLDRPADLERWLAERPGGDPRWRRLSLRLLRALAARRHLAAPSRLGRPLSPAVPPLPGRSPPPPSA